MIGDDFTVTAPASGKPKTRLYIGSITVIATLVALVAAITYLYRLDQARRKEERAKWQQKYDSEEFARVKSGQSQVSVFGDSSNLLAMLADDEDCVRNLQWVHFDMLDLRDARFVEIKSLPNVHKISFYDCENVVPLLASVKDMPSVNELRFSGTRITDDLLDQLQSFPNLKKLRFSWLTQNQADWLERELPNVVVKVEEITGDPSSIDR